MQKMSGFKQLYLTSQHLEQALDNAIVGAVPCSQAGHFDEETERWEKIIADKMNEIKLLNSKAILVTASIQKDNLPTSGESPEMAQMRLCKATATRLRWGNALNTMAASRAVLKAFQERRQADMVVASELLLKLSGLQQTLEQLDTREAEKERELAAAIHAWHRATVKYKGVSSGASARVVAKAGESETDSHLHTLIGKMKVMDKITNRLIGSAMEAGVPYDWEKDPGKLLPVLAKSRHQQFTPDSFL